MRLIWEIVIGFTPLYEQIITIIDFSYPLQVYEHYSVFVITMLLYNTPRINVISASLTELFAPLTLQSYDFYSSLQYESSPSKNSSITITPLSLLLIDLPSSILLPMDLFWSHRWVFHSDHDEVLYLYKSWPIISMLVRPTPSISLRQFMIFFDILVLSAFHLPL